MKALIIIFIMLFTFSFADAQHSFQATKMISDYEDDEQDTEEKVKAKITLNSDTTEIEIKFKHAKLVEEVGNLHMTHTHETYKMIIYQQKEGDWVLLHFEKDKLFAVTFQSKHKRLQFE